MSMDFHSSNKFYFLGENFLCMRTDIEYFNSNGVKISYAWVGMTIGPSFYGYLQKVPTMGRVESRIYGSGHGPG